MNRINYLFKRVQCWVQSGIFGYCGNGTGNRVHTPLYIGGVPCTHLNTHNHSTHLKNAVLKEGYPPPPPVKKCKRWAVTPSKNFFPLKFKST